MKLYTFPLSKRFAQNLFVVLLAFSIISGCSQEITTNNIEVDDDKTVGRVALPDSI